MKSCFIQIVLVVAKYIQIECVYFGATIIVLNKMMIGFHGLIRLLFGGLPITKAGLDNFSTGLRIFNFCKNDFAFF